MIQRVQTIYFAIAALILIYFSTGASILGFQGNDLTYVLQSNQLIGSTQGNAGALVSSQYFFVGSIIAALWTIFVIISYRNLTKQLSFARVGSFIYLAFIAVIALTHFIASSLAEDLTVTEHPVSYKFGFYLLILGYVSYLLGMRGIKKDKKLVDSVDRIR